MTPFSLVTACMNREPHLRRNLPAWLRLPGLAEVVVVDWSNQRPLEELRQVDPRVRVLRVVDEPHWILSYAYNLGVQEATLPLVLKCDADCAPRPEVVSHFPASDHFCAGNWRSGTPLGKPSVNGQCLFWKSQFDAVNGYSEIIRTYGRDDEDFYDRLIAAGFPRHEIPPAVLDFIEHGHGDRTANQSIDPDPRSFLATTAFKEMRNCFLAKIIPWNKSSRRAAYRAVEEGERLRVLARDKLSEVTVPADVEASARLWALRYFVMQFARLPESAAQKLDERACLVVIAARTTPVAQSAAAAAQRRAS